MSDLPAPNVPPPLDLPALALVVVVGAPLSGKSAFAAQHFSPDELFDENRFADPEALLRAVGERLASGRLAAVVVAAVKPDARRRFVALAKSHDLEAVAVVLDPDRAELEARHAATRSELPRESLLAAMAELRRTRRGLPQEGFRVAYVLRTPQERAEARFRRVRLPVDASHLPGPFDLIGDVHGCRTELLDLLERLGYHAPAGGGTPRSSAGRTAVFLGDLVDRGPDSAGTLRLVMDMVREGSALCVPGNHDAKLLRALQGKAVRLEHGLARTLEELDEAGPAFRAEVRRFLEGLPGHLILDGGRLVAAHAGLPERFHGRHSVRTERFALYGDVDGRTDELGRPLRGDWAADYGGAALVVYGHTPVAAPRWLRGTVNIDTGCVFGGALTALRYPEREMRSVPARAVYASRL